VVLLSSDYDEKAFGHLCHKYRRHDTPIKRFIVVEIRREGDLFFVPAACYGIQPLTSETPPWI